MNTGAAHGTDRSRIAGVKWWTTILIGVVVVPLGVG